MHVRGECSFGDEEIEAYGDQVAAASIQFLWKSRDEPIKPSDRQNRVVQLARSDIGHLSFKYSTSKF